MKNTPPKKLKINTLVPCQFGFVGFRSALCLADQSAERKRTRQNRLDSVLGEGIFDRKLVSPFIK